MFWLWGPWRYRSFLMEAHNYSFMEAVKELAGRAGLPLPQETVEKGDSAPGGPDASPSSAPRGKYVVP